LSLPEAVEPLSSGLADQIYERLRSAVLEGGYAPGERVNPKVLAARFGASITPVRDALRRLENDGLVEIAPRRGVFIVRLTRQMARETFEIRMLLECGSADRVEGAPDRTAEHMVAIVAGMEGLQEGNTYTDYPRYLDLDRELHTELIRLYGNGRLLEIYSNLRWPVQLAIALTRSGDRRAEPTIEEHRAIVRAVEDRNPAALRAAIEVHLANALSDLLKHLTE
jgi:GntR family transcriptional regulator, rspAB operon transcriptional repressor